VTARGCGITYIVARKGLQPAIRRATRNCKLRGIRAAIFKAVKRRASVMVCRSQGTGPLSFKDGFCFRAQ
jgi:hypothetical protein